MTIEDYTTQNEITENETTVADTDLVATDGTTNDSGCTENETTDVSIEDDDTASKVYMWIPAPVYRIIADRSKFERRTNTAVVQKAIEEFLEEPTYECRPYIPVNLLTNHIRYDRKVSYTIPRKMLSDLTQRADNEGRAMNVVFIASILRYIVRHKDECD